MPPVRQSPTCFAGLFAKHLRDAGLTQRQFADLVGVSRSEVAMVATGRNRPPKRDLFRWLEALKIHPFSVHAAEFTRAAAMAHVPKELRPAMLKSCPACAASTPADAAPMSDPKLQAALRRRVLLQRVTVIRVARCIEAEARALHEVYTDGQGGWDCPAAKLQHDRYRSEARSLRRAAKTGIG
jgi:transcriptional regulator with XRE-family HTH domain